MTQHADYLVYFPKLYSKTLALSLAEKRNYLNSLHSMLGSIYKYVKAQTQNNFTKSGRYGNFLKKYISLIHQHKVHTIRKCQSFGISNYGDHSMYDF